MKHSLVLAALLGVAFAVHAAEPIRQHPSNPRYFLWRGKATALITSAEHYGMVLNPALDYRKYLAALERDGLNYTRVFSGAYVEPPGSFGIERNTLAPAPGRFLAPWARSSEPGYAGGGNRFDLDRFSPEYTARLKDFVAEAGKRGVVVEVTLFSSTYSDAQWALSPFNPTNNVNGIHVSHWKLLQTAGHGNALPFQERMVRHLVRELNGFDNVLFEIQNEPWSDNHTMGDLINPYLTKESQFPNAVEIATEPSVAWQMRIAAIIANEESRLPHRHLIAQNIANFRLPVRTADWAPEATLINFHYAYPEAVLWNLGAGKLIGYDETGFAGREDETYRRQAWRFLLAGGGLFNNLDYSFTQGHEDGDDTSNRAPGGGSPELRRQLGVLKRFLDAFDLTTLKPDLATVRFSPGVITHALSTPGKQYAVYVEGRSPTTLTLNVPAARYRAEWLDPVKGGVRERKELTSTDGSLRLISPPFDGAIGLRLVRVPAKKK